MKKVKLNRKLRLNKVTVATLRDDLMKRMKGGITKGPDCIWTQMTYCDTCFCPTVTGCETVCNSDPCCAVKDQDFID
jgi:hypothetical protein